MTNCKECASLCCIAPSISRPDENQWRVLGNIIKEVNTRCEKLCTDGSCAIHDSRGAKYENCIRYDCDWFGPELTKYIREYSLFEADGTLNPEALRIFSILNRMIQIRSIFNRDLADALNEFREKNDWPVWMLTEEYWDYLFKPWLTKQNPRNKKNIIQLAISRFSL
jgi:hypothetical protein